MTTSAAASPRVLMVTPRYFPAVGGVETHVDQVARRLVAAGAAVTVLTTDPSGRLPRHEQRADVRIERVRAWPARRDYYFAPGIYGVMARGGWDLVHCQSYHTLVAPLAMLAAAQLRLPYIVTFHGGGHSSRLRNAIRQPQWALLRPLLARAARLVAIARFEIGLYSQRLRLPRERFVLIPNGADLPTVPPTSQSATSGRLIASVGRLERYKGHHRVLQALPRVLERHPDARLRIVGVGPYEATLRQMAQQLGVAERVEIGGIPPTDRHGMAALMSSAALVTLLSEYETHPIAALEALALRRPVLVANGSGLGELAERGLARAIDSDSTDAEVASAIIEQLERPLIPPPIELPSWDDCAAGLLALYRSIIDRQALCVS